MTSKPHIDTGAPVALAAFTAQAGLNPVTAWRWRKKGWITTINIAGRQYITREEVERFNARAAAGEFARDAAMPRRSPTSVITLNPDTRHSS